MEKSASRLAVPEASRSEEDPAVSGVCRFAASSTWPSRLNTVDVNHRLTGLYSDLSTLIIVKALKRVVWWCNGSVSDLELRGCWSGLGMLSSDYYLDG